MVARQPVEVPFVAGEHYSIADITALVTVDFAAKAINVPLAIVAAFSTMRDLVVPVV